MKNGKNALKVSAQIELRLPDLSFAAPLALIINQQREYLSRQFPWVDSLRTEADVRKYIQAANAYNQGGQKLTTFIFYENKLAGAVSLVRIDKINHIGELGFWLREELQGNGIMEKSCERLIAYTFKHMNINRIELKTIPDNKRAINLARRLAFQYEGSLRSALFNRAQYFDLEVFSLLSEDWKIKKG